MERKVTLGVCGGVAAYKAAELVRAMQRLEMDVHVIMTRAAEQFIQPLTFASLTGHRVLTSLWTQVGPAPGDAPIEHIAEAQRAEVLVVAPLTAYTLAKFANGLADDYLSTLYLATSAPVVVAPAMNVNMWGHPATRANVARLRELGVIFVEPGEGYLACGMTGGGRMAEVPEITEAVVAAMRASTDLSAETILITAGGTREPIDPVRFIGNRSSGKMGHALADVAVRRGAHVVLITASALPSPAGSEVVRVNTAEEMRSAVLACLSRVTAVIKAAAVADYRPRAAEPHKIKRSANPLQLEMEPTPDILAEVMAKRTSDTLVIAFAAETRDVLEHARLKLDRKGVDAIVANDVTGSSTGFDTDRNAAVFLTRERVTELPESSKQELAGRILDELLHLRSEQRTGRPVGLAMPS